MKKYDSPKPTRMNLNEFHAEFIRIHGQDRWIEIAYKALLLAIVESERLTTLDKGHYHGKRYG